MEYMAQKMDEQVEGAISENERLLARVAELEDANARMREVIASQPLNSPTRLAAVAEILASVEKH